jgi:hypothetical protein
MSRRKGAVGEREAAEKLNEVLGTRFHRGRQYHGGPDSPDLAGDLPGLHVEVKRVERLALYPAMYQARRDAAPDQVPMVMHRANNRPWLVVVEVADLIRLLDVVDAHRAKSGEPVDGGPVGQLDGGPVGRSDGGTVGRSDGAALAKTGTPDGGGI